MVDWIISNGKFILSNWQIVLVGGIVAVSVVIFLMEILKKTLVDKITNKDLRKFILFFVSLILSAPVTLVDLIYNGIPLERFWVLYIIYTMCMVFIYQFYACAYVKKLLGIAGGKILKTFFSPGVNHAEKKEVAEKINADVVSTLKKYTEDDIEELLK